MQSQKQLKRLFTDRNQKVKQRAQVTKLKV
jgi:hypothetical protein